MDLPSRIVYNELETDYSDLSNYNKMCYKKLDRTDNEEVKEICKKSLRFIEKSALWRTPSASYDICLQVNYWIYDKLINILGSDDIDNIEIAFGGFQLAGDNIMNTVKYISYNNRCNPNFNIFKENDWENKKKLYEYYVDYDTLFGSASAIHDVCKDYYKKIKEYFSLYEYFQGKCPTAGYICPEFFHKLKSEKRQYKLENLPCYREMEQAISAAAVQEKVSSSHHQSGTERRSGAPSDGLGSPGSKLGTLDTVSSSQSSDIGTKVSHTVLGAAPVLLTATALYRYTPLGPWIRRFGGGRTNNMNDMDAFSPYTQKTSNMFSEESENYISYQPI
ncbi:PIR protein [Plasmodium vivax]|uniref:VIR protein n=1 Tax=Plasmodium vivax TaxID=5855 RepID=A0A564ZPK4_PLAVI|nr:PIR protein [Plasmodium vivax]